MTTRAQDDLQTSQHSGFMAGAIQAEKAVLGACLIDSEAAEEVLHLLKEPDFSVLTHRQLFAAVRDLSLKNKPHDALAVAALINERKQLEEEGVGAYIGRVMDSCVTVANVSYYASLVIRAARLRRVAEVAHNLSVQILEEKGELDPGDLADRAATALLEVGKARGGVSAESMIEVMPRTLEQIDKASKTKGLEISTGWPHIDEITLGLHPGTVLVIAGRPGSGKTSAGLNLAVDVAVRQKIPAAFFSLEMSVESLTLRMLSSTASVNLYKLRTGHMLDRDRAQLVNAASLLSDAPLYLTGPGFTTLPSLVTSIRQLKRRHGIRVVVIDYLQLLPSGGRFGTRNDEVAHISNKLKEIAGQTQMAMVVCAQLNRENTRSVGTSKAENRRPRISDLRDSGSIEQDADDIILLHQDTDSKNEDGDMQTEFIIGKQRQGETPSIPMIWQGRFTRFVQHQVQPQVISSSETPDRDWRQK